MVRRPPHRLIYPNLLSRTVRQDKQASHPPALFLPDFHIFCIFYSIYSPFLQSPNPRSSETAVSCTIIHIKDRTLLSTFNRKQQCESTDDDTEKLWQILLQSRVKVFFKKIKEVLPGQVLIQSRAGNEKKTLAIIGIFQKPIVTPTAPDTETFQPWIVKKRHTDL